MSSGDAEHLFIICQKTLFRTRQQEPISNITKSYMSEAQYHCARESEWRKNAQGFHDGACHSICFPSTKYSKNLPPAGILREPFYKIFQKIAPAGILGEPFYKIFQNIGPCGRIKGAILQMFQFFAPAGILREPFKISKMMFRGTYFGFDICNPKLFTFKNRSSIVPSLQNLYVIHFLIIFMPNKMPFSKNVENQL